MNTPGWGGGILSMNTPGWGGGILFIRLILSSEILNPSVRVDTGSTLTIPR